jgi:dipeptidyl aminopeptidase/acylaminoacyl peptidase
MDLADTPPTPSVRLDPTHQTLLIMGRPSYPSIEEVSKPELRLAGLRIDPKTRGPSRYRYYTSLTFQRIKDSKKTVVSGLPENAKISDVSFSPDGKKLAFIIHEKHGLSLWTADLKLGKAVRLTDPVLNDVYGSAYRWMPDSKYLLCLTVPEGIEKPASPEEKTYGPVIQETSGRKAPARTYQDLLKSPEDIALFSYLMQSEVIRVNLSGEKDDLGGPAMYKRISPSPDGRYLLVEVMQKPFSFLVPSSRFPYTIEIRDRDWKLIKQFADIPLAEEIPIGRNAVRTGRRNIGWRQDKPSMLYWVEAQDGGDPNKKTDIRDSIFLLDAPFAGQPVHLVSLGLRFSGIDWASDKLALAYEYWWRTRQVRTWKIEPGNPAKKPHLLFDRSYEDRYSDPGRPMTTRLSNGASVLLTAGKGKAIFLSGMGASPQGNRPFVDRLLFTGNTTKTLRIWQSSGPYYERPVTYLYPRKNALFFSRESQTEPPNYFLKDFKSKKERQLTHFPHPAPQLKEAKKELIKYMRDDGVQLTANLYLPPGYKSSDGPLPMLMWAYPREFKSAKAAGQVRGSPYQFIRVSWGGPHFWLAMGYAVLDGPAMPIVGEGEEEPNDTFVRQLVASAQAAVDEVVRRGIADPDRIAIGGHSYGAFMTANLLAHSDLFATGIARSGAYNRTLTPFGFQSEERTYWQAPDIYFNMSPFMHAPKVNEPILLIHGAADNNSGTFPLQSERYYNALKGHGVKARLVMLPNESHGYRARESVMHTLYEMNAWLEQYCKKAD